MLLTLCAEATLLTLALPRVARACGSTPCALQADVMPADGSTAVPTNTELRVLYFGTLEGNAPSGVACALPLSRMRLVDDAGNALELEATMEQAGETEAWMVARPDPSLMPDTRYVLEVRASQAGDCACDGALAWSQVAAFTTGDGVDEEPPSWSGAVKVRAGERVEEDGMCGSSNGWTIDVAFEPARDASPGVRYDIFVDGTRATRYVEDPSNEMFVDCGSETLFTSTVLRPGAHVELQAVDLAGNTSPAASIEQEDVVCQEGGASAGTGGAVIDRGATKPRVDTEAPKSDSGAGSCTARAGTRGSLRPDALLALLLVLVVGSSHRSR